MEIALNTDDMRGAEISVAPQQQQHAQVENKDQLMNAAQLQCPIQQQQQQPKAKRKHRRGKPKSKNAKKPYKKTNWKFQMPRISYKNKGNGGGGGGCGVIGGGGRGNNRNGVARAKLIRSRSLVPYNTNKFLMEEHLADVPNGLLTPSGRTRDSSFSVDSEDNYFFSLPEDEEEFLTKEFANVYERARVEHLENLTKQQLIEECLQMENRYVTDKGAEQQEQLNMQLERITAEFMAKIRFLEERLRTVTRENYNLRCQLMRTTAAATASPPSATAPVGSACQPTPMDSSSEDSESDSSSSNSSTSSSSSSAENNDNMEQQGRRSRRSRSSSTHSSLSEYNAYIENNYVGNGENCIGDEGQQHQMLDVRMEDAEEEDDAEGEEDASDINVPLAAVQAVYGESSSPSPLEETYGVNMSPPNSNSNAQSLSAVSTTVAQEEHNGLDKCEVPMEEMRSEQQQ